MPPLYLFSRNDDMDCVLQQIASTCCCVQCTRIYPSVVHVYVCVSYVCFWKMLLFATCKGRLPTRQAFLPLIPHSWWEQQEMISQSFCCKLLFSCGPTVPGQRRQTRTLRETVWKNATWRYGKWQANRWQSLSLSGEFITLRSGWLTVWWSLCFIIHFLFFFLKAHTPLPQ